MLPRAFALVAFLTVAASSASAQTGYEFEVYSAGIGPVGSTELELSSNYVASGLKEFNEGRYPTHHATRSTLELSRTLSSWIQGTAYISANARPGQGFSYVGNRLKLTAIAPSTWNLPFGLGLANEIIYARPGFSEYEWAYELTPIIAREFGRFEVVFNPAFERGLSGSGEHEIEMEPRGKVAYTAGDDAELALEYYAGLGGIGEGYSVSEQRHQVFGKFETELSPQIEGVFGLGRGLTRSSDKWVITAAFEYKFRD